ncbi:MULTISPECIES: phosphate ABC transporter permease PstA [Gammaproteobacteria]|uniref:phosphate ABC transporter permease PstA n=1 Tax=Gammaproteobacteria TaxID=1236 RepID=UPI000DD00848|nr:MULTISPECIES: phosphate ABC transporter permease PstA [Gammaproteobacteria]RTE85537.1 phosphate ABC transporter permease PstA [Aliidiomarina sp. B3213]TCZ89506.1 phosphate ABC transporter permease PstA [Lysobacter sp. N42]
MKNWFKSGAPWIWLTGGAVTLSVVMVVGLLGLIAVRGFSHFWPADVAIIEINEPETGATSRLMGEIVRTEGMTAAAAREAGNTVPEDRELVKRYLIKQGNRDQFGTDFVWRFEFGMSEFEYTEGVYVIERREWGNFYGFPTAIEIDGETQQTLADNPEDFHEAVQSAVDTSVEYHHRIRNIERGEIGRINNEIESLRLQERQFQLDGLEGEALEQATAALDVRRAELEAEYLELRNELDALYEDMHRNTLRMQMVDGAEVPIHFADIVSITMPNDMNALQKWGEYFHRVWVFLTAEPREANTEGGIFPAIFGTITMVFVMSILVTPFGVLAAIYLREYAKQGPITKMVRISVYNLAGVPSIVFGVFGLGFFIYFLGGNIDRIFYEAALPSPTFGTPGLFWASLTLALLTLPVVIVSTEEGLARIPSTIRQGSLALGATKSETLWRVVVPLATPGMMTGLILAIARAAGEVAPLMLVGVVKLAPTLPIDGEFPFIHLERKIMHLGFHIFDVGFQSPNVEAARPLVYATALTLVALIIILNISAISIRNHLREKYRSDSD